MEHVIGILLYRATGVNQTFEEKQGHVSLPRARQAVKKEHATSCVPAMT